MKYQRIGIDLDNTIIDYHRPLLELASNRGLKGKSKVDIREELRKSPSGDRVWQEIQAELYTSGLSDASLSCGVEDFLGTCQSQGVRVFIVSHKTEYSTALRDSGSFYDAAQNFLEKSCLVPRLMARTDVFFEPSRDDKINRINELNLDLFLDDLPEVLLHPKLSSDTEKVLFEPDKSKHVQFANKVRSFSDFSRYVFAY